MLLKAECGGWDSFCSPQNSYFSCFTPTGLGMSEGTPQATFLSVFSWWCFFCLLSSWPFWSSPSSQPSAGRNARRSLLNAAHHLVFNLNRFTSLKMCRCPLLSSGVSVSCLRNLVTQVCENKKAGKTCPAGSQEEAGCLKLKYGNGCASGPSASPHSQERAHLERIWATWNSQCPVAIIK